MLKNGDKVGRFIIEEVLGEGGMGIVYKAHDEHLVRDIAIKVLATSGDEEGAARVLRESRVAAALDHPNAVTIFEGGVIDGEPYIAMELVPGETLRSYIGDDHIPVNRKVRWLVEIGRALAAAHRAGIVHRDVKPENVMVRPDGRIKVLDFGIARRTTTAPSASAPTIRALVPTVTTKGAILGTPMYMAPEQVRGNTADGRSDQFSWAIVAYELLEGERPWHAHDALGLVAAMMSEPPRPMSARGVPEAVRNVVMRALSRIPAERFGSMDDVVSLLEPLSEGTETTPLDSGKPRQKKPNDSIAGSRYSTHDLGQAIALALERKAKADAEGGKYTYEDLEAAAKEVGVEAEDLRAALLSLRQSVSKEPNAAKSDKEIVAIEAAAEDENEGETYEVRRARAKHKLQRHAGIWGVFCVTFATLGIVTHAGIDIMVPALFWGFGVGVHAVTYLFPVTPTPEEKEKERLRLAKRREKLLRKLPDNLKRPAAAEKLRIAGPPRRVEEPKNTDTDNTLSDEMLAEEEAGKRTARRLKR